MLVVMVLQLNYDEVRIVDADNKSWRKDAHPVLVAL